MSTLVHVPTYSAFKTFTRNLSLLLANVNPLTSALDSPCLLLSDSPAILFPLQHPFVPHFDLSHRHTGYFVSKWQACSSKICICFFPSWEDALPQDSHMTFFLSSPGPSPNGSSQGCLLWPPCLKLQPHWVWIFPKVTSNEPHLESLSPWVRAEPVICF